MRRFKNLENKRHNPFFASSGRGLVQMPDVFHSIYGQIQIYNHRNWAGILNQA